MTLDQSGINVLHNKCLNSDSVSVDVYDLLQCLRSLFVGEVKGTQYKAGTVVTFYK